ncbi:MAG: DUF4328 domain-containing protein [Ignavibacteriaceae bacterium]|nr:DUF4328 domain-containing protein [Ignavibacteriaceae bacterium]
MDSENKIKCPNCLSPVSDDAEACPNCNVDFYNCSNCNSLVLESDTICKNCNSRLNDIKIESTERITYNRGNFYKYKPLEVLSNILVILLSAEILFSIINIYGVTKEISFLKSNSEYLEPIYADEISFENILIVFSSMVYVIIFFPTLIVYLIWVRQAYRNLHSLQLFPTQYSSGWAIGSYFVPILNLFRPYKIMKEIWFGSQSKSIQDGESDYDRIKRLTSTTFLTTWWTVALIDGFFSNLSFRLSLKADTNQELVTSNWIDIISSTTGIFLALLLLYLITTVKNWQSEKIKGKPKRYCQHCANLVELDALLCTHCGKELIQSV